MAFQLPFLGRLHFAEYLALLASLLFLLLEVFVRIITLALPDPIINLFYRSSKRLFNYLSSPASRRNRDKNKATVQPIVKASDFVELCEVNGYQAEEHVVQTKDGYFLGLHRLAYRNGEEDVKINTGSDGIQKKVVFCMHGLLMNSEVWVCQTDKERCLAFQLVEQGYDVWFGNNRGNKYSKKHARYTPTDVEFWSFSIDHFAFNDIPDSIEYILKTTSQPSLSYVGFSQGTAQAFASLSIHPYLNHMVDVFVALAPAMSPPGLSSSLVNSLTRASPNFLYLAFGRRAILGSAPMWEAILYPPIFVRFIDMGTRFLFGWHNKNMSANQKLAAYPHLYSFTSTKSVVHWFQIIRTGKFQMYDDETEGVFSISDSSKYYKVAKFPTRNIRTPIVMLYGGSDSLVDINVMLKELPKHVEVREIPHYEHLDFLWANDVHEHVFHHVYHALDKYANEKEGESNSYTLNQASPQLRISPKRPHRDIDNDSVSTIDSKLHIHKHSESLTPTSVTFKLPVSSTSTNTDHSLSIRPEGWWSSSASSPITPVTPSAANPAQGPKESPPRVLNQATNKTSASSLLASTLGDRGISVGTSKPVGGVDRQVAASKGGGNGVDKHGGKRKKIT